VAILLEYAGRKTKIWYIDSGKNVSAGIITIFCEMSFVVSYLVVSVLGKPAASSFKYKNILYPENGGSRFHQYNGN